MDSRTEPAEGIEHAAHPKAGPSKPRKRFVGTTATKGAGSRAPRRVANQIPDDILRDVQLNEAIKGLPSNYNFEIHKTIHQIRRDGIQTVALQMPEGLMVYGCAIADIVEQWGGPLVHDRYELIDTRFTGAQPLLLADVTYGACCIDDYTAKSLGAELIVHYGHSCLIPVSQTSIKTLYVFVEIQIDVPHLCLSVRRNFPSDREAFKRAVIGADRAETGARVEIGMEAPSADAAAAEAEAKENGELPTRLALVSTIQFVAAIQALREDLEKRLTPLEQDKVDEEQDGMLARMNAKDIGVWRGAYNVTIPQSRPLSPGEVLGCTAPKLKDMDGVIYVGDGRFHLESIMIANPSVPAFRYDPYSKKFTRETYEHTEMRSVRADQVKRARQSLLDKGPGSWAVILGTLGRQGSLGVHKSVTSAIPSSSEPPFLLLLSELSPQKLALFPPDQIEAFVQTSCPRLSIDWGYAFSRPLLSPYEASVAVGRVRGWDGIDYSRPRASTPNSLGDAGQRLASSVEERGNGPEKADDGYPMDFYADASLGPWTPRHSALKAS